MPVQAELKANELLQLLNRLDRVSRPDEITLRKIRREAESILESDPYGANSVLGFVAAAELDERKTRNHFGRSINLRPMDPGAYHNFAVALSSLGFLSEARKHSQKAHDLAPGSLLVLDALIGFAVVAGRFAQAAGLLDERRKLGPDADHPDSEAVHNLAALAREHNLSDDRIEELQETASEVLHARGSFSTNLAYRILEDDESKFVGGEWSVSRSVQEIRSLNLELASRLAAHQVPNPAESLVTFVFLPGPDYAVHS